MGNSIVEVTRGGITESVHDGVIAIMGSDGKLIASYGDTQRITFARSSCKPFQAIPLVESGAMESYSFDEADLALFCASHSSEQQHTDRVEQVLHQIGLDESFLKCGPHLPHSMSTYDELVKSGKSLTSLYSNCSGKHSGMLAYAKHTGTDVANYQELRHPLQQAILTVVSELTEVSKEDIVIGVDGCGVPVHALPVINWARAYAKFANPDENPHGSAMARISTAMRRYPELVGGTDRFDTDLMKATHGRILAKGGAEGFMMVVVPDMDFAMAIKILDGHARAIPPVVIKALVDLDALSNTEVESLRRYERPEVVNTRGEVSGHIITDFSFSYGESAII